MKMTSRTPWITALALIGLSGSLRLASGAGPHDWPLLTPKWIFHAGDENTAPPTPIP